MIHRGRVRGTHFEPKLTALGIRPIERAQRPELVGSHNRCHALKARQLTFPLERKALGVPNLCRPRMGCGVQPHEFQHSQLTFQRQRRNLLVEFRNDVGFALSLPSQPSLILSVIRQQPTASMTYGCDKNIAPASLM